jgi:hypothetical protein
MALFLKWTLVFFTYIISLIKPRYGVGFVIFFLPLASRSMVFGEIQISIMVFMVFALLAGCLIKDVSPKKEVNYKAIKLMNKEVLFLFLLSILISFIGYLINGLPANVTMLINETSNLINYIAVLISAMTLYIILVKIINSAADWFYYVKIFLSGLLFLGFMYILSGPLHINLPDFLQPISVFDSTVNIKGVSDVYSGARFAGYVGYYENFVEYLVIIIALAIILIFKRKNRLDLLLGISVIGTSLFFGLLSATRSFPLLLIIFFILILMFQLIGGNRKQTLISGTLVIGGLVIIYFGLSIFTNSLLVSRFSSMGISNFSDIVYKLADDPGNNFFALINRPEMLIYFDPIVKTSGIIGVGPLTIHTLSGTVMVFHNGYYGIYVSLGLLGLFSYLLLNFNIMKGLQRTFQNNRSEIMYSISFSLLITLLIDAIKVSFWRIPPTVFIYWFVFALIVSFTNLWKTGNWNS